MLNKTVTWKLKCIKPASAIGLGVIAFPKIGDNHKKTYDFKESEFIIKLNIKSPPDQKLPLPRQAVNSVNAKG